MLPFEHERRGGLLIMLLGFAAAALLTLGAAVGTSMLHQQTPRQESTAADSPVAQR